jgi:hypothetical protein
VEGLPVGGGSESPGSSWAGQVRFFAVPFLRTMHHKITPGMIWSKNAVKSMSPIYLNSTLLQYPNRKPHHPGLLEKIKIFVVCFFSENLFMRLIISPLKSGIKR